MNPDVPGPGLWEVVRAIPALSRDPLGVFRDWRSRYGRCFRIAGRKPPTFFISDITDARHVLIANQDNYEKKGNLAAARAFFGDGLIASNGDLHRRERQRILPHMVGARLGHVPRVVAEFAPRAFDEWDDGSVVDVAAALRKIALAVVGQILFGEDLWPDAGPLTDALDECHRCIQAGTFTPWPRAVRLWRRIGSSAALAKVDRVLWSIIEKRRGDAASPRNLLTALLQGAGDQREREKLVRDEMFTLLGAGYDTTANAVAWTLYLLGRNSGTLARIRADLDASSPSAPTETGGPPAIDRALREGMRLYPPIWCIGRHAVGADRLPSGVEIPPGSHTVIMIFMMQRDSALFSDPDRFDPDRFQSESSPPGFMPFGLGPRSCVGEPFAMLEASAVLSDFLERFDFELATPRAVATEPLISLRPRGGLWLRVRRRTPAGRGVGIAKS